jgi:hypothetical protein
MHETLRMVRRAPALVATELLPTLWSVLAPRRSVPAVLGVLARPFRSGPVPAGDAPVASAYCHHGPTTYPCSPRQFGYDIFCHAHPSHEWPCPHADNVPG